MEIATLADLDALLAERKLVVVDYHASWCAPCRSYSPKFARIEREMRRQFPDASFAFAGCDIDLAQDAARDANVRSVPTTIAWTTGRGLFGGAKRKEALRFSGDRPWADLVRTFTDLLATRAREP